MKVKGRSFQRNSKADR